MYFHGYILPVYRSFLRFFKLRVLCMDISMDMRYTIATTKIQAAPTGAQSRKMLRLTAHKGRPYISVVNPV